MNVAKKGGHPQLGETDSVAVDEVRRQLPAVLVPDLMLNKPEGVVSASTDKRHTGGGSDRGCLPRRELVPGGRLDKTSTGLFC